jgi:cyanophycinase-like exopeptidase
VPYNVPNAAPPPTYPTPVDPQGDLIVIGGRENKEGHRPILEEVARRANGGKIVVTTFGSDEPEETMERLREGLSGTRREGRGPPRCP